jgi:D-proline reductase (dithiol) PrdB
VEIIEQIDAWRKQYADWKGSEDPSVNGDIGKDYPFVKNRLSPFTPARRALPMLNLALISSAGAYIDGTEPFINESTSVQDFREIPTRVEPQDLRFVTRGYDPTAVENDPNAQVPLDRLFEFQSNRIIGRLNEVFWSFPGYIPDAATFVLEQLPSLVERLKRYEVQAALLIPASRLCHQSVALSARAIEDAGIPTMTLAVVKDVIESVRAPRAAFYEGALGSVAGKPDWPEHQRRVLDEALRLLEPMDQAGLRKLVVDLETQVECARGER